MVFFVVFVLVLNICVDAEANCFSKCICTDSTVYCSAVQNGAKIFEQSDRIADLTNVSVVNSAVSDLSSFPSFGKLLYLDLSNNNISVFNTPKYLSFPTVITLNLENNRFETLGRDAFLMFPNVEDLNLSGNGLIGIDWEAFRLLRLRRLTLSRNRLVMINEHMLRFTPNLEYLDLSYNDLVSVQSSNFFSAQKLREMNLSHNKIRRFDYDSFSPLYQLKILDISYNELSTIPGSDLRQLVGLRVLNLSANNFDRVAEGELVLPALQELSISRCPALRLVEPGAFSNVPSLQTLDLSYSRSLVFISPYAFANNSSLLSMNLSHSSLETASEQLLATAAKVALSGNPLQCGCISRPVAMFSARVLDFAQTNCSIPSGTIKRLSSLSTKEEECRPEPILPFGDSLIATVGELFSIYCASRQSNDSVFWRFPNGTEVAASSKVAENHLGAHDLFSSPVHSVGSHGHQFNGQQPTRSRVTVSSEQLKIDAILPSDGGEYRCSIRRGTHLSHRIIRLSVVKPVISLYTLEVGSHYVALAWNDSLKVKASNRVQLFLTVKDAKGISSRSIQLSLYNPWFSYNVMRLKANQNYTFCLCYMLTEGGDEHLVYETCVEVLTLQNLSFFDSLSLTTVTAFLAVVITLCALLCVRGLYMRLHIWQQEKHRSRMNQSVSGQSFLSSSSNGRDPSLSMTYENQLQLSMSQSTSFHRFVPTSSSNRNGGLASGRLLTAEDMAL